MESSSETVKYQENLEAWALNDDELEVLAFITLMVMGSIFSLLSLCSGSENQSLAKGKNSFIPHPH